MAYQLYIVIGTGIVLRLWLFGTSIADWLAERNELSTPLTAWKRVTEGLTLNRVGVSPYSGDVYHEMPLMLCLWNYLDRNWGSAIKFIFVAADVITALVLRSVASRVATHVLKQQAENVKNYHVTADKLLLKAESLALNRLYVVGAHMFNPLAIAACVAKSTAIFNNLTIALAFLFMLKANRFATCVFICLAAYQSMYPVMLIVPAAIFIAQEDIKLVKEKKEIAFASIIQSILCTSCGLGLLLYGSFLLQNSWEFLRSTYGFILTVPDLTPNIGIFWYFFTEMFEHFRLFFICVFQIHAFIYIVPLTFRLREHPIFFMYVLLVLIAIFKSYPSYADIALYLSLLPMWRHVIPYMRNNFVITIMFVVCIVIGPILWHLWLFAGSANANFYFAITLVLCTAQVFLITDLLFAYLRREFDLFNGTKLPMVDGKPGQVLLD